MSLWVVRHAPIGVEGVCYGQSDVPTKLDAWESADAIERRLPRARLCVVCTSATVRTRRVAEVLAERTGASLVVDPRLAELSFGEWEGRSYAELEQNDAARFLEWMSNWRTAAPPAGESLPELMARVGEWRVEWSARADALAAASPASEPEATVLAVTHAGVMRALRAGSRGCTYEAELANAVPFLEPEPVPPSEGAT